MAGGVDYSKGGGRPEAAKVLGTVGSAAIAAQGREAQVRCICVLYQQCRSSLKFQDRGFAPLFPEQAWV